MARNTRNVKRTGAGGRAGLVRRYNTRAWYEMPDWLVTWIVANIGWVALIFAAILAPAALLATFLGVHSLPLSYVGIPVAATSNDIGVAAVAAIVEFILLALAVRPLRQRRKFGWKLLIVAAAVRFVHSLILQHGVTGAILLVLALYCYWQVSREYE